MRKNFKIVEDKPPPLPEYGPGYTQLKVPKNFNPTQQALETIKNEYQKYKTCKSEDPDGYMKNITLTPYSEKLEGGGSKKYKQIYSFKIKAKDDPDTYRGRVFEGRIQFPDNYPQDPPKLIMNYLPNGRPLQMVNLYPDGGVCHHTVNEEYYKYPKFDLPYILSELEGLLYRPNPKDPANFELGKYFVAYPDAYWKFQKQQAKLLPLAEQ